MMSRHICRSAWPHKSNIYTTFASRHSCMHSQPRNLESRDKCDRRGLVFGPAGSAHGRRPAVPRACCMPLLRARAVCCWRGGARAVLRGAGSTRPSAKRRPAGGCLFAAAHLRRARGVPVLSGAVLQRRHHMHNVHVCRGVLLPCFWRGRGGCSMPTGGRARAIDLRLRGACAPHGSLSLHWGARDADSCAAHVWVLRAQCCGRVFCGPIC
jgi:hypothetical protein